MKKRLLSALLALALVFVLLPTTALADTTPVTDENVKINGTAVIVGNDISLGEGNGTYSYDKATHTLTLNSATINATTGNIGISFGVPVKRNIDYKIELVGNNSITSTSAQAIYVEYDTSVDASLNDTMKRSTLTINGSAGSSLSLNVSGTGSKEAIEAIWSKGDFTLSGGTAVTAFSSDKIAVNVGSMTINNSKLSAQSSSYGTTVVLYGFEMIGDAAEFEALNTSSSVRAVLRTSGASENIDWSKYQLITGSYSGNALTKSEPTVCDKNTLNDLFSSSSTTRYIHIAKRTIPALETTSDVRIAGDPAVVGVETSIPSANGSGTYYYDQASKTLTLNNVNIASSSIINGIQFTKDGTYTIKLVGTNTMSGFSTGISANSADQYVSNINITVTGAGSLEVSATKYAIAMNKGDLKFENTGEIKLTTSNISPTHNVLSVSGNISIADMEKYKVEGIVQDYTSDGGDTVTLSEASHLKGYQNPGDTQKTCLKSITIAPKPSETYYNNTAMKYGETKTVGNGTISCDENGVITLNGVTEGTLEFKSSADSTLVLEGTNTLSSIVTTQKSLTISGSGSLTVGSIKVHKEKSTSTTGNTIPNLTITGGAQVTVNRPSNEDLRAIDIDGDLTVTNGSLTATSNSTKPTVQVGGNATFTGSTVTITNNSDRQGKSGEYSYAVSTGLYVGGTLDIKNAAKVTSTVIGGNAIYAKGDITISGDNTEVNAKNSAYKFSAISTNGTVNISDNSTVKAENLKKHQGDPTGVTDPSTGKTYNACPAITGKIANKNSQNKLHIAGFTTSSAGSQNPTEGTPLYLDIAPGSVEPYIHHYYVTITRGDEVTRTKSPVVIAGTTLLNDTYYTITNDSTVVANGSESNYNAFYNSTTKTLKLNNAKISTTTENAAIEIRGDLAITVTGTNELKGNYNHCIESWSNFTINGTGTLNMTNTSSSSSAASVIYCGPYKNLTIAAEVIIKNEAKPGNLIFTVEKDAYSFAEGYNVYASTDVSGSPLETYDAAKGSTYKYLRITKENLAPTTPTTYTVTITTGDNMSRESGTLIQEVTKGAAITEVKFIAASGHYFPADYVSKMNLPAGLTAEISGNSWYLTIKGTPTSNVTINLPATSVRPTITVSMPTPVAGNTPATASDITLTYTPSQGSSRNLRVGSVIWESYVPDGPKGESIKVTGTLSSGDKFVEGTKYRATINFEGVSEDYAIVPAAGTTKWSNAEWGSSTMTLYFDATGAPCNHKYTNDWHANGNTHWHECELCKAHADEAEHTYGGWITDTEPTATVAGTKHRVCSVCDYVEQGNIPATGEIVPPTPDNPGTIVIIRPAEEEKPAQQPNPSTGANDLVGLAVAAAVAAALGSAALLRKHD